MTTIEDFKALSNEEIHSIFWDMYKDVYNVRPRFMDPEDREGMLSWIENELRPEIIEMRRAQWEEEAKWLAEQELRMEQEHAQWVTEQNEKEAERQAQEWYALEQSLAA